MAARLLGRLAERLGAHASVGTVFGRPVTNGGITVIPVARVAFGLGGGSGWDRGSARTGEGLGGGGGSMARPAGFIEIREGEARYVPIRLQRAEMLYGLAAVIAALSAPRIIRALVRRRR
jgi:uncharacterized spore protein YtfJ